MNNKNKSGHNSPNQTELKEFIKKIDTTFFVELYDYKSYIIRGFNSKDLSFLELISICELCELNSFDDYMMCDIPNISYLFSLAISKIITCEDQELKKEALAGITDLECVKNRVDIDRMFNKKEYNIKSDPYFTNFKFNEKAKKSSFL